MKACAVRKALCVALAMMGVALAQVAGATEFPPNPQIDRIFGQWDNGDSPGCAIAVIKAGDIIYKRGYGMADLDHKIRITPSTVFHAASLAKQFTAMSIMLLVERRQLSLNDDVRTHLPELPDLGKPITIGDMLHHMSGIRDQWALVTMAGWRMSDDVITREDVLRLVRRMQSLNSEPRAEPIYSNTGYTLAALVVERVSNQPLSYFAHTNIFKPLGMTRTKFTETPGQVVEDRAYGYRGTYPPFELRMPNYALAGPTNLVTTVEDLARWDRNFDDKTVGGDDALSRMQTPGVLSDGSNTDYGLGLRISEYRKLKIVEHDGRDAGYRSHLMRFPDQQFSVAILCNLALPDASLPGVLARRVAHVYLADQFASLPHNEEPTVAASVVPQQELPRVGVYWNSRTSSLAQVSVDQGKALLCFAQDCGLMAPLGRNRFEWIGGSRTANVEITADPTQAQLLFRIDGEPMLVFAATPPARRTPTELLAEYTGRYYSAEIDTVYDIELDGSSLAIVRHKYPPTTLKPIFHNGFTVKDFSTVLQSGIVHFQRNSQDQVIGFRFDAHRGVNNPIIRNFHFSKLP
jgi:CubicO group peptidase (beta-lactamase class C family)